jgi:hypothetical protein
MRTRQGIGPFFYHLFMLKHRCVDWATTAVVPRDSPSRTLGVAVQQGGGSVRK